VNSGVFPELFQLGPLTVYTYGLLLAAAYLLGLRLAMSRARARGMDPAAMLDLGIYIIISALVGAKLLLLVVDFDEFRRSPAELLTLARSGGVFYGGLILAVGVAFWYIWRHRLPVWQTCDVFAPGIALGQTIGRLGCFAAGCCYGKPASIPWAVTFTSPEAAANVGTPLGIPLHPTQLYESVADLIILFVLLASERRGRAFPGRTFWLYMLLYGMSRFAVEVFRGDPRGTVLGVLSTSQFVAVLIVPVSLIMLYWLARPAQPAGGATTTRLKGAPQAG
jgi:phosphatidylglycerol:prolipoprotein diacylglycerol transferase